MVDVPGIGCDDSANGLLPKAGCNVCALLMVRESVSRFLRTEAERLAAVVPDAVLWYRERVKERRGEVYMATTESAMAWCELCDALSSVAERVPVAVVVVVVVKDSAKECAIGAGEWIVANEFVGDRKVYESREGMERVDSPDAGSPE